MEFAVLSPDLRKFPVFLILSNAGSLLIFVRIPQPFAPQELLSHFIEALPGRLLLCGSTSRSR